MTFSTHDIGPAAAAAAAQQQQQQQLLLLLLLLLQLHLIFIIQPTFLELLQVGQSPKVNSLYRPMVSCCPPSSVKALMVWTAHNTHDIQAV